MLLKSPEKIIRIVDGEFCWGHINRNGDFVGRTSVPIHLCNVVEIHKITAISVPKLYKGLRYTDSAHLLCDRDDDYAICTIEGNTLKIKLPYYMLESYQVLPNEVHGPYLSDYVNDKLTSEKFLMLCVFCLIRTNPKMARRFAAGRNNTRQVLGHILQLLREDHCLRTFSEARSSLRQRFIIFLKARLVDELVGNINTTPYDKQEYL